ncbi:MAG: hypothetical protein ACRDD9_00925 [Shewanella sp.]
MKNLLILTIVALFISSTAQAKQAAAPTMAVLATVTNNLPYKQSTHTPSIHITYHSTNYLDV